MLWSGIPWVRQRNIDYYDLRETLVQLCDAHDKMRNDAVKVYVGDAEERRLIGRADIPDSVGPVFEVPVFGATAVMVHRFAVGTVTNMGPSGGSLAVERAVLLSKGQPPELLPGWQPLVS